MTPLQLPLRVLLLLAAAWLCLLAPLPAEARGKDQDAARRGVEEGSLVPLASVVARVRARFGGRLIDAALEGREYRLLWETSEERILRVRVDAETGEILAVQGQAR